MKLHGLWLSRTKVRVVQHPKALPIPKIEKVKKVDVKPRPKAETPSPPSRYDMIRMAVRKIPFISSHQK